MPIVISDAIIVNYPTHPSLPTQPVEAVTLPHFAYPFKFAGGAARVLEQDTVPEIAACVAYAASCPTGARPEQPKFGIPDPLFGPVPVPAEGVVDAIQRWEPRADIEASEQGRPDSPSSRTLSLDVEAR